jgi:hypothetical protein
LLTSSPWTAPLLIENNGEELVDGTLSLGIVAPHLTELVQERENDMYLVAYVVFTHGARVETVRAGPKPAVDESPLPRRRSPSPKGDARLSYALSARAGEPFDIEEDGARQFPDNVSAVEAPSRGRVDPQRPFG